MKFTIASAVLLLCGSQFVFAAPSKTTSKASSTKDYIPQHSPVFPDLPPATGVVTSYNYGPYDLSKTLPTYTLKGYPPTWKTPSTKSAEVKAAIDKIDWSLVPKAPVRIQDANGNFVPNTDGPADPYCWWSDTNCVTPKINIPQDYYKCPRKGDWGLSYDDGPFNLYTGKYARKENPYAEPALYNFLAENNNQKATLFYIGSNVVTYPAAAKRALNHGHYICVHTWSHPAMTTKTNEEVVAELYWTLRAIKEATGITPKCWRPPQGDVDDRVRSIAWQMGLHTVMWDRDTNDWAMPAPGGGHLPPSTVDGYFKKWVSKERRGKDKTGHIVLEHELNSATVGMTMKWMPTIQKVFNVIPALACNSVSRPYWEEQFVYPLENKPAEDEGDDEDCDDTDDTDDTDNTSSSAETDNYNSLTAYIHL
ncbi:uncharacterized protein BX663DRAFT_526839 [Cokeromyces recurvatus]|uniref:uncharacterized protein n=1 Tax=Cokeromyces recurvatus TaxID=90255 RepID=UPI002221149B|nr:uncharacterized protein BX663DRAFT_526839 [Cokeromyces recurvatus]KAI7897896.1 hypothetical protein BX663DRAFT_526839 [Cokeromyces recurvatus]